MYQGVQLFGLLLSACVFESVATYTNAISVQRPWCNQPDCPCCNSCDVTGSCGGNCTDGYHGDKCYNQCPANCVTCSDLNDQANHAGYANCTQCQEGFYSTDELYQCQLTCPSGCRSCISEEDCTVCKDGYHGSNCTKQCTNGSAKCAQNTGISLLCKNNFGGTNCDSCTSGKYGVNCSLNCPEGCHNGACNRADGTCSPCTGAKDEPHCKRCTSGMYGKFCNITCPSGCFESICQWDTGHCSHGCTDNLSGNICSFCRPGFFGSSCNRQCPANCKNGVCTRVSGYCHACIDGFSGPSCDSCLPGFYGRNCSIMCPGMCLYGVCRQDTGSCLACADPTRYGTYCEHDCSQFCYNNTCEKDSGRCTLGCKVPDSDDVALNISCTVFDQLAADGKESWTSLTYISIATGSAVLAVVGVAMAIYGRWPRKKGNHVEGTQTELPARVFIDDVSYINLRLNTISSSTEGQEPDQNRQYDTMVDELIQHQQDRQYESLDDAYSAEGSYINMTSAEQRV